MGYPKVRGSQKTTAGDRTKTGRGGGQTLLSGVMRTLELSLKQMSHALAFVSATFRWAYTFGNDMVQGARGCERPTRASGCIASRTLRGGCCGENGGREGQRCGQ